MKIVLILFSISINTLTAYSQNFLGKTYRECMESVDIVNYEVETTSQDGESVIVLKRHKGDSEDHAIILTIRNDNTLMSGKCYKEDHSYYLEMYEGLKVYLKEQGYKLYGPWKTDKDFLFTKGKGSSFSCILMRSLHPESVQLFFRNDIIYQDQ